MCRIETRGFKLSTWPLIYTALLCHRAGGRSHAGIHAGRRVAREPQGTLTHGNNKVKLASGRMYDNNNNNNDGRLATRWRSDGDSPAVRRLIDGAEAYFLLIQLLPPRILRVITANKKATSSVASKEKQPMSQVDRWKESIRLCCPPPVWIYSPIKS